MLKISDDISNNDLDEIKEVRAYWKRIYSVLRKDIREKLKNLNVSEEKKKSIIKELAFLSNKKQIKYLEELYRIYN
ncbi:MAG: hypothetical protein ACFE8L_04820 [Candidatus Hodarchaeota archaeon]